MSLFYSLVCFAHPLLTFVYRPFTLRECEERDSPSVSTVKVTPHWLLCAALFPSLSLSHTDTHFLLTGQKMDREEGHTSETLKSGFLPSHC